MAEKIPMLALSPTMEEGTIVKWVKAKGDSVEMSEVLCEVETDKATMEFESPAEGTLLEIFVEEGSSASVGQTIAVVGEEGEDISGIEPDEGEQPSGEQEESQQEETEEPEPQEQKEEKPEPKAEKQEKASEKKPAAKAKGDKIKSSPLARKLAKEKGIELSNVEGTGPDGRITRADVEKAAQGDESKAAPAKGDGREYTPQPAKMPQMEGPAISEQSVPVSGMRKAIAQRLSESKFTAPHYYLRTSVIMDSLLRARGKLNKSMNTKVSLNAFLMKFTALALARHPGVNATWQGDTILRHGSVDVALAVAIEDGLITPVVRGCHEKGILVIEAELKTLIEKARSGQLKQDEYANSTFTISNLGSYGIEEFTAIINPPNSAILAVGKIGKTPVADDQDHINVHSVMKMTLSCDHRVIDGALGAVFLQDLKDLIEYPVNLLV